MPCPSYLAQAFKLVVTGSVRERRLCDFTVDLALLMWTAMLEGEQNDVGCHVCVRRELLYKVPLRSGSCCQIVCLF